MPYPSQPNIGHGSTATPVGVTNWNIFVSNINHIGSDLVNRFTVRSLPYGKVRTITGTQPSVSAGNAFRTTNAATTLITQFKNGATGQVIMVNFATANTRVQSTTAYIQLQGNLDFYATIYDSITLRLVGGRWIEQGRSLNT